MALVTALGIGAIILLLPIFVLKKEYGLYTLVIVRPLIDLFSNYTIFSYRAISLNLSAVVALVVIAWFLTLVLRERLSWQHSTGLGWLALLLLWGGLSALVSIDLMQTVSEWLRLSALVIIFVVAYQVAHQRPHALTRLVPVIAIAMVIPVAVALVQLVTASGLSFGGLDNRVYGTFGHPNVLGFYLVITISLLIVHRLRQNKTEQSLLYPWLLAAGALALAFTYTRGAYLGFVLIQIIIGWMYYRKVLVIGLTTIVGLIIGWQLLNTVMISTFNYNLNDIALLQRITTRDEEADSIDWRVEVFNQMAPKTLESPFLGFGLGNFVTLRRQGDIGLFDDPEAHNDYLRLAVEIGFVGTALYLLFWISLCATLWRHYRSHHESSWQKKYALFGVALILAILGMSVGDNVLQGTAVMWTALAILATIVVETRPQPR